MDSEVLQRTRYLLQARVRTAKTCPPALFPSACKHLLDWIDRSPFVRGVAASIEEAAKQYEKRLAAEVFELDDDERVEGPWAPATREDAAALALASLRRVRDLDLSHATSDEAAGLAFALAATRCSARSGRDDAVEAIRDVAVQALYEFLDEEIDGRHAVLGLLVKYKARSEMYRRRRLREAAASDMEGRSGEKALAFDLYEYLHDQGVDFSIESKSASGEPDLISRDIRGERLVADAKYVRPNLEDNKVLKVVASGFRQVLDYCRDHNETVGYLVIFVARDLVLDLRSERDDGFPCFRTGGYTVYYVIIDIHDHEETASKRPTPRVIEVTQEMLVEQIAAVDVAADEPDAS